MDTKFIYDEADNSMIYFKHQQFILDNQYHCVHILLSTILRWWFTHHGIYESERKLNSFITVIVCMSRHL
jgi:hypothetical protein